ncbi:MAG: hypothetical protein ACHQWU_05500 [Gemmatimonadales bacterium]
MPSSQQGTMPTNMKPDAAVERLAAELRDTQFAAELTPVFARSRSASAARAAEIEAATLSTLRQSSAFQSIRAAARASLPQRDQAIAQARAAAGDPNLSVTGQTARAAEITAMIAAVGERFDATAKQSGARLRASAATPGLQSAPRAEWLTAEATFWAKYPHVPSAAILREGAALLAVASDPKTPVEMQARANFLLQECIQPAAERRATAPESFARHLAPAYADLSDAVTGHLDVALGHVEHRAAQQVADQVEGEAAFIVSLFADADADVTVLKIAAPTLLADDE